MRNFVFALAALATLGGAVSADAEGLADHRVIHGVVLHPHPIHGIVFRRVCEAWRGFGVERHCVRWRVIR